MKLTTWVTHLVLMLLPALVFAYAPLSFDSEEQEQRFKDLTEELRCAVCQNQSLADSDAPLAQDLREEIHGMLRDGLSDEQIRRFLVDRYGEFVLYRPAMKGNTLLLWLAPALLLLGGGIVVIYSVYRHRLAGQTVDVDADDSHEDLKN